MQREHAYSEAYEEALRLAIVAHRHQMRKGSGLPYIVHPVHVSVILLRHGFSMEAAIAGLLHDVVEDQGYDLSKITEQFGPVVMEMVDVLSERKLDASGERRAWTVRKREALARVRTASSDTVAVKAADALHNTRSFLRDLRRDGPEIWRHFNVGPEKQLDYYREIVEVCTDRLGSHPLTDELADAVTDLAREISRTN